MEVILLGQFINLIFRGVKGACFAGGKEEEIGAASPREHSRAGSSVAAGKRGSRKHGRWRTTELASLSSAYVRAQCRRAAQQLKQLLPVLCTGAHTNSRSQICRLWGGLEDRCEQDADSMEDLAEMEKGDEPAKPPADPIQT